MEHFLAVLVAALLIGALWGALTRLYDAYPNFGGLFEIMNSAAR